MTPQVSFFKHTIHGLSLTVFCSKVPGWVCRQVVAMLCFAEGRAHLTFALPMLAGVFRA